MNTKLGSISLSILGVACALAMPAVSHAGNVGYFEMCGGSQPAHAAAITAAGQTPVAVTTPDAASLVGLTALSVTNCDNGGYSSTYTSNQAAITSAVNGGMLLIVHDRYVTGASGILPGGSGLNAVRDFTDGANIDIPAGSPILTGPGGSLNNTSLDGGSSSSHGYVTTGSLPAGAHIIATQGDTTHAVTIAYNYGAGSVTYSTIPLDYYFNGSSPAAFKDIYAPNIIAAAVAGFVSTTCASEGYKGAQLTWCKNICENGLTGQVLDTWIHRWIDRYRQLPYCARETPPPPPPPQGG